MSNVTKMSQAVRVPPHDDEAERAVLGCVLMDQATLTRDLAGLEPQHMYRSSHGLIWAEMLAMSERGDMIDVLTLSSAMKLSGYLHEVGGANFLAKLAREIPSTANAGEYARIVRAASQRRDLIRLARRMEDELHAPLEDAAQTLASYQREIMALTRGDGRGLEHIKGALKGHLDEMFARYEGLIPPAIMTGLTALDDITNGWQRGDFIIIGARPAMGKTTLAMDAATRFAQGVNGADPIAVGVFSIEMGAEQLAMRMSCNLSGVDSTNVQRIKLSQAEWARYVDAAANVAQLPMYIDDTGGIHLAELCGRARQAVADHDIRVIVIDYIQLIRVKGARGKREEISEVSVTLKALAKELQVTIIGVAQLNRGVEKRDDRRPRMSDLRESGQLEQDADQIIMLYRDVVYNEDTERPEEMEAIVVKNRSGMCGTAVLRWIGACYKVDDL